MAAAATTRDWYACSGAQVLRAASAVSFREYAAHARSGGNRTPATLDDDRRQIELDLARARASVREFVLRESVGPDDAFEGDGEDDEEEDARLAPILAMLRDILLAYSLRNPRVGYVQGHADVVCFLLGNINDRRDEEEVFWVYASLIERVFPEDFFARTPKLHGFQVDNRLFKELVARKLVDLTFVTSLLSCKWFVSVWVGHLPVDLLCKVWDVMLAEDEGGAIAHLLLGLHFFQRAVDGLAARNEAGDWDSSRLYQIILKSSQEVDADLDPRDILHQGQSMHGLNDESVEDMRSTLRLDPQLQRPEFAELARTTKFNASELERLHEEFTFVRFYTKAYERVKLRGVRQEYFESLIAREFSTWPVDICGRLFQVMKPDGYGNASFSSLAQMLSVLARGEHEEKAALLFAVPDVQERKLLSQDGVNQLADLLCCLFANKALAATSPHPLAGAERDALLRNSSEQSPLLRSQFRKKFEALASGREALDWDSWLELARTDREILSLMEWDLLDRTGSATGSQQHYKKTLEQCDASAATSLRSPVDFDGKHHQRHGHGKTRLASSQAHTNGISSPVVSPAAVAAMPESKARRLSLSSLPGRTRELRRVSLLSKQMKDKFKVSRAMIAGDSGLRRNPFEAQFPAGHAAMSNHWCQCTIS